jgi:DNA-binding HxlR family transcriptional regulator
MSRKRQYLDGSFTAHGLDLVGSRWALLIISELMLGPQRFSELRNRISGIAANMLTKRLAELEAAQIITRHKLPLHTSASAYQLTDWGRELEEVLQAIDKWQTRASAKCRGKEKGYVI